MFLVKKEELRNLDVFYRDYLCVFLELGRDKKKHVEKLVNKQISEKFIALARFSRQQPLEGRQPQKYFNRVDLDTFGKILIFQFLKRYGT